MPDNKTVTFDASQWQPIETAPRGVKGICWMLLAWGPEDDQTTGKGMRIGDRYFAAGSFFCSGGDKPFEFREIEVSPTHWMPLPAASGATPTPAAQSAGQEAGTWRDAIETAVQVLSQIEAGDDVFVGQASEAIAGLTAILHGQTIPPTFEQARDALCDALDAYPPKRDVAPVNGGERELGQVIDERDQYHDAAEKLADAIAKHFGVEIGEHSNLNCPWQNALDHIAQATKRAADAQQVGGRSLVWDDACVVLKGWLDKSGASFDDQCQLFRELAALTSPAKVGGDEREVLSRAIDCLEILNKRPSPLCRDCADNFGTCPHTGLACNMGVLIKKSRAALSADGGEDKRDAERYRFLEEQVRAGTYRGIISRSAIDAAIAANQAKGDA